jgi:hypothetical protein
LVVDAQHRIAELEAERDAERSRSLRLEQQIGALLEQVTALTQRVAELTERLGQNSRNSHLPPSSDPPGTGGKGGGQRPRSDRPRGGQRGHRGSRRELVATSHQRPSSASHSATSQTTRSRSRAFSTTDTCR